ncbi:HTTM domain-containing protein [Mammaliicoccus sp. C-M14]|uniref:HTTM domain-containing protein n=1 Tax=Mammaliicoccus sp. C-M14 TaxID=2898674 RepID=UPI001EFC19F4|nr:HTTM domain-containing protein [Mammaliicoccus sp. C-M14]
MNDFINRYINRLTSKLHGTIGLSIIRLGIGIVIIILMATAFPIRESLWNNKIFSNVNIEFTSIEFNIFYTLALIIIILFTLGIESILFNVLVFIVIALFYNLNGYITDGGNNLISICLFYMIFTKNAQYFSIYKGKREKFGDYQIALNNLFYFLILFQVCVLYFFSGFAKARGQMWYSGVAPYYVFNINSFTMEWIKPIVNLAISSTFIITLISYLSIFMQMFFPFLLLNKYTKVVAIIGSISFHLGIIFIMGLVPFGIVMIAFDLAFIKNEYYMKIYNFLKGRKNVNEKQINSV